MGTGRRLASRCAVPLVWLVALALVACASPARHLADQATARGFSAELVVGAGFRHVVFRQPRAPSRTLHVYLDGDGTPWRLGRATADPTPRSPLVLDLMALDSRPSLYLGRPCYHGLAGEPPCRSALWTEARYSEEVVASMTAALRRILRGGDVDRVVLFGHSGGGVLAVLLAPRIPETAGVVTVAANLDIDGWADLHGYPRLSGSLLPAQQPPLPARISQRHYAGAADRIVPPEIVARGPIAPGTLRVIPSYDHVCCWTTIWPAILAEVEGRAEAGGEASGDGNGASVSEPGRAEAGGEASGDGNGASVSEPGRAEAGGEASGKGKLASVSEPGRAEAGGEASGKGKLASASEPGR